MDTSEFPSFSNADTIIASPAGHIWKLHYFQLTIHSPVFARTLGDAPAATVGKPQKADGSSIRFKLNMDHSGPRCLVQFVPQDPNDKDLETTPQHGNGLGQAQPNYYRPYNNFFRILYNLDPEFDTPKDLDAMIIDLIHVLEVGENLQATKVIRKTIDHALITSQGFFRHVMKSPELWADVACRLHSTTIFREAICHLVGKCSTHGMSDQSKSRLEVLEYGADIIKLCEAKTRDLNQLKIITESRVVGHYPETMLPGPLIGSGGIAKRSIYANNIYQWQALSVIRQWITRAIQENQHHLSPEDGGVAFYRKLGSAGDAYVGDQEINEFHNLFPMSGKGQEIFRNAVYTIKDQISPLLQPLLIDRSTHGQSLGGRQKLSHLTCTEVSEEEMPWIGREAAAQKATTEVRDADRLVREEREQFVEGDGLKAEEEPVQHNQSNGVLDNLSAKGQKTRGTVQTNTTAPMTRVDMMDSTTAGWQSSDTATASAGAKEDDQIAKRACPQPSVETSSLSTTALDPNPDLLTTAETAARDGQATETASRNGDVTVKQDFENAMQSIEQREGGTGPTGTKRKWMNTN